MSSYLDAIDAQMWPGIALVPRLRFAGIRQRRAEAEFAQAVDTAGLTLEGKNPDLRVIHEALFARIAANGWVGVAESFMAGEWVTEDTKSLENVLRKLIVSGYSPKTPEVSITPDSGGELPASLVRLYAGDGISHHAGLYSTGVPTTVRESFPSYSSGSKTHFVDITTLSDPTAVDREDLASSQVRTAQWLLDAGRVGAGSHVLVYPASGAQSAIQAASRRAVVDVLTADAGAVHALQEFLVLEGALENVALTLIEEPVPGVKQWRGRYDTIISQDKLPALSEVQRGSFARNMDRLLAPNGRLVLQSQVATEQLSRAGRDALLALRAYIWPGLNLPTVAQVHQCLESNSHLRIIAQTHSGNHSQESLAQQASFFDGHLREAAAAGFDSVFRRLWVYQFALRQALFATGMMDDVQFTAVRRHRSGQR